MIISTETKIKVVAVILGILFIAASSSALYFWYKKPPVVSKTEYVTVEKIKTVTKIKEVRVPGPTEIITIDKPVLVQKIDGLPEWFKSNPDEHGIASAVIESYKGKTNAIATMNVKTGKGNIIAKQEPLSLFGLINEKEIGIRAGYRLDSDGATMDGTVYGQWDFLRVGNVHVGIYGEGGTRGEGKAQIQFGYKF